MGVLRSSCAIAIALVAITGCYAPSLRDCKVSCASQGDCAGGQVCGSDGLCASPELAGRCAAAAPDAGPGRDAGLPRDAMPSDAASTDAPAMISLHVQVTGKGSIVVDGYGVCSSESPQHGDCTYDIAPHVAQSVHALPIQPDQGFGSWTSATCRGQGATCMFTPIAATMIAAKFEHVGGGG